MRIRTIKPEFWRSEDIAQLDPWERLLFIGLWNYVDDNGVGKDNSAAIAGDLFVHDLENDPSIFFKVESGLKHLADAGLIQRYEVDGRRYVYVSAWSLHQRINRPSRARLPLPVTIHGALTEHSLSPHVKAVNTHGVLTESKAIPRRDQVKTAIHGGLTEPSLSPHAKIPIGTGNREQGTGNREQGTGNREGAPAAVWNAPADLPNWNQP